MTKHQHQDRELAVFTRFLSARGITSNAGDYSKRPEPEPDILFAPPGEQPIAYELVELLDQGWGQLMSDMYTVQAALKQAHATLPPETKALFDSKYGNADIGFAFTNESTNGQRRNAMPEILAAMIELPDGFQGLALEHDVRFLPPLDHIYVGRAPTLRGPIFHPSGGMSVGEPTVPTLKTKFAKSYRAAAPIELLAYIDRNAHFPDDVWQANVAEFVENVDAVPFRRIWILDLKPEKLHCVYSSD